MPYLQQSQLDVSPLFIWGQRTDRLTATLPQTTNAPIFTVAGGKVCINLLVGEVTTIIQAQANLTKLIAVPTTGSNVDLCGTVDISALEVGGKLVPAGVLATALGKTLAGAAVTTLNPMVVAIGTINLSCAASSTGSVKWSAFWIPQDDGATLLAA
jgi:hypothetical protein